MTDTPSSIPSGSPTETSSDGPRRRKRAPSRVGIIIVVVAVLAGAAVVGRVDASDSASNATLDIASARFPPAGAPSTAWYCAEGTSAPGGRGDERVYVANIGDRPVRADITVMPGADQAPKTTTLPVAARSSESVRIGDVLAAPEVGVLVEVSGGTAVVSHSIASGTDLGVGPCARGPSATWDFAAGTTARGAQLWLALYNPFSDDAIVDLHFLTDQGLVAPEQLQGFVVPRRSRVSVPVHDSVSRDNLVSTQVIVRRGRAIAEQSLILDGTDGRAGLALSLGAPAAARTWRFPAGLQADGRRQEIIVANPAAVPTKVKVSIDLDGTATLDPETVSVPAGTAVRADLTRIPKGTGFSVTVTAPDPVIAETIVAVVAPSPAITRGLATALGMTRAARVWAVAPARASASSNDVVTVLNPGPGSARVSIRSFSNGQADELRDGATKTVKAGERGLFDIGRLRVPRDAVAVVSATAPVLVEREGSSGPGLTLAGAIPDLG